MIIEFVYLFIGLVIGFIFGFLTNKPKKESKSKLTEEDLRLLERLENIKEYARQLKSDLNFGYIDDQQYGIQIAPIVHELKEIEKYINEKISENISGEQINFLNEIFNLKVHKAIEEVENESL